MIAANRGTVTDGTNPTTFNNFATLSGGNSIDAFTVNAAGSITTINGHNGDDTFTLFGAVTTLNGGDDSDTVTLNTGSTVSTINGGDGDDTVTLNDASTVSTVNGDIGNDQFNITNSLSNSTFNGGVGDDDFAVSGNVTNVTLNGEGGSDDFSVGAVTSLVVVGGEDVGDTDVDSLGSTIAGFELTLGDTALVAGVTASEIEAMSAIDGILNARDGTTTTWNIDAINGGNVSDSGTGGSSAPENLAFTGFVDLNGGNGVDLFNLSASGAVTGAVTGGGGDDQLNITLDNTRTQSGQMSFDGGAGGTDEITLTGTVINETYTPNVGAYDQLAYDNGSGITFDVNFRETETVSDNVQASTLTINSAGSSDTVQLGNSTFGVTSTSNSTSNTNEVDYVGGSKTNITVQARNGSDVNITDDITLGGNLMITADEINQTAMTTINVNGLILNNVNQAGSSGNGLATNVDQLSVINHSGTVFIEEQDAIAITQMANNTGAINVTTTTGSINSNAALSSSGALNLNAAESINLDGNNQLSGALTLNGTTINVNNRSATHLASATAEQLTVTSVGEITATGAVTVHTSNSTGLAVLTSSAGNIILNNGANNFDTVHLDAANDATLIESDGITLTNTTVGGALNVTANSGLSAGNALIGDMQLGDITAGTINLNASEGAMVSQSSNLLAGAVTLAAAQGIGGGDINYTSGSGGGFSNLDTSGAINTTTSTLSAINTTAGTVNINNTGNVSVQDLRNSGDVILSNAGDITLNVTERDGVAVGAIDANYGGSISAPVYAGSVAILNGNANSVSTTGVGFAEADITAESLFVNSVSRFGDQARPIRLRINDQFTLIASQGAVFYVGDEPGNITTSADLALLVIDGGAGLSGQQLIDIDSLGNIDPAIFSEVRNYNYGDTAIRLPADQRASGENEGEEEEDDEEEV